MLIHKMVAPAVALIWLSASSLAAGQEHDADSVLHWIEYRIGPEDVLTISVWKNPELTRTVQVRPDGKISLLLVNDLQAAGLTPMELRDAIGQKLEEYVSAPEVSVIVDEVHSFKVSILGKVQSPGRYELGSPTTLLDALALAGGLLDDQFSSADEIVVLRPQGEILKRIPIKYKVAIKETGKAVNIYVQANDIIVVP